MNWQFPVAVKYRELIVSHITERNLYIRDISTFMQRLCVSVCAWGAWESSSTVYIRAIVCLDSRNWTLLIQTHFYREFANREVSGLLADITRRLSSDPLQQLWYRASSAEKMLPFYLCVL